jgi:hypothetical protein
MAEYWAFLNMLRHDLGKSYTVAQEHTIDRQHVNVLVRRQRHDELLVAVMDVRWLALLQEGAMTARDEYKQFVGVVRNYFANPAALPAQTFAWPGTAENRTALQRLLDPRRTARAV